MDERSAIPRWKIEPSRKVFDFQLGEFWQYKDLLLQFVRRDFLASYKQTILGPAWLVLQPLLTAAMYIVIFSRVARISTDELPPVLFYLLGIILWNYFSECLAACAGIFKDYTEIFNKVYFPRLIVPFSSLFSFLIRFGIQFLLFMVVYLVYLFAGASIHITWNVLLLPAALIMAGMFGMGIGLLIASASTKYRDLYNLVGFGLRLYMFATPVFYPISIIPDEYKFIIWLNPLTACIETFRIGLLGSGYFEWSFFLISALTVLIIWILGVIAYNRAEQNVVDVI
ncbi:MAG: ABC transporter permease [Cyclobacteriaceae bacterium]|jgi:lipopolysaccharide transport system permease protein|nr:ABC transporter permease [Cyclobacteriaceae bacterium]